MPAGIPRKDRTSSGVNPSTFGSGGRDVPLAMIELVELGRDALATVADGVGAGFGGGTRDVFTEPPELGPVELATPTDVGDTEIGCEIRDGLTVPEPG
jgi:hypothetical protein